MSHHTPAPWQWDPDDDYRYITDGATSAFAKRVICDLRGDPQDKETRSNAHLIAMAPELFEFVKRLRDSAVWDTNMARWGVAAEALISKVEHQS